MHVDDYQLKAQIRATAEYVAYRAVNPNGVRAELRTYRITSTDRWSQINRQLRLASIVEHPGVRPTLHLELEASPPKAVLGEVDGFNFTTEYSPDRPLELPAAMSQLKQIAEALSAAHRFGLAHGDLNTNCIYCVHDKPIVDFSANVSDTAATFADDILALADVFSWLVCGEFGICQSLIERMQSAEAADRPTADEVIQALTKLEQSSQGTEGDVSIDWSHQTMGDADEPIGHGTMIVDRDSIIDEFFNIEDAVEPEKPTHHTIEDPEFAPPKPSDTSVVPPDDAKKIAAGAESDERNSSFDDIERMDRTFVSSETKASGFDLGQDNVGNVAETIDRKNKKEDKPRADIIDLTKHRDSIGRFRLLSLLGEGGMGTVYKAEAPIDGRFVAIKVLRSDLTENPKVMRRFHKEARLLAEVKNPYVANFLEVNEDDGLHFMAIEFVPGSDLASHIQKNGVLSERDAIAAVADVTRALVDAHEQDIIHRDLKPENILLQISEDGGLPKVKLTDFGLARHVDETESLHLTSAGTLLGTPLYMSPEQCKGDDLDPRADVYSLGATFYHLLVGEPPFSAPSIVALIAKHINEPAPRVRNKNPEVSDAVETIIARCLEKSPESRYQKAGELLADLDKLLRGKPTSIQAHPQVPMGDPGAVLSYDFVWELNGTPDRIWPHICNTERLNRAIGLPSVDYTAEANENGGTHRYGNFRKAGMNIKWQEHPFEWIEGRKMGVLREYTAGPLAWFTSIVELSPRMDGGTTLAHRIRVLPTNMVGRTVAKIEVGVKSKRSLEQVYRRIDAVVSGELGQHADPFENVPDLPTPRRKRLDTMLDELISEGVPSTIAEKLGEFIATAPAQELARIRPIVLAQRLTLDPDQLLAACLQAASTGLFVMMWDILCPICRIPSQIKETLKSLDQHGNCEACNVDFDLDFANSIELIFRVSSEIHDCETGTYCIGGPAHSPHVVSQVRLAAQERFNLDLSMTEGTYRLRGPQLPFVFDFRVAQNATPTRLNLNLSQGIEPDVPCVLKDGPQIITLINEQDYEVVARIERTASKADSVTAARAATTPKFRELFPGECLTPGQLISVENVTLLVTELEHAEQMYSELGDAKAFEKIHGHFRDLDDVIRTEGGSLVKTLGEGLVATFHDPVSAARAPLAMREMNDGQLKVVVHRGPAMVATLNDHLDYFGTTVNVSKRVLAEAKPGVVHLSNSIAGDEQISTLLEGAQLLAEVADMDVEDLGDVVIHQLTTSSED